MDLENTLEQEQELLVNRLWKRMDRLEAEKRLVELFTFILPSSNFTWQLLSPHCRVRNVVFEVHLFWFVACRMRNITFKVHLFSFMAYRIRSIIFGAC